MAKTAAKRGAKTTTTKSAPAAPSRSKQVAAGVSEKVGTQTISGSVPTPIVRRVREVARLEDRTTSQVVASALDLYTRLPTEAHLSLRRIELEHGAEELERTLAIVSRQIFSEEFETTMRALASQIKHPRLDELETEEDIMDFAVEIVKASYARDRTERRADGD